MSTMILNELKFSDARNVKKNSLTVEKLKNYLNNNDFDKVGSGQKSIVYVKRDSNLVVRLTHKPDPCWLTFYEFAMNHQKKTPHVPRIGKMIKLEDNPNLYVVFMEKLVPIVYDTNVLRAFSIKLDSCTYAPKDTDKFNDLLKFMKDNDFPSSLISIMKILYFQIGPCNWDLHDGNIMKRPRTNEFVIIDPYFKYEPEPETDRRRPIFRPIKRGD